MKWDEYKKIAAARSPTPWVDEGHSVLTVGPNADLGLDLSVMSDHDKAFICMAANKWAAIEKVIDAAKIFCTAYVIEVDESTEPMIKAIEELER